MAKHWGYKEMPVRYSDVEIARMLKERKTLPVNWRTCIQLRDKRGHKERELGLIGEAGTLYRVILRQSHFNAIDFSIIIAMNPSESNLIFRLRRYNGKSHEHTNQIEGNTFYDFHVHHASERYQESGAREDAYAEVTDRYADYHTALRCMLEDCRFEVPLNAQPSLFGEFDI